MPKIATKIAKSFRKNAPEMAALLSGRMPKYVYGIKNFRDIPVFCFHSAKYPQFELQLQYLERNGYRTLSADELYERLNDRSYKNSAKEIVLTFDDGMASVYAVAYPLLQDYGQKIISFVLPGLIKEGDEAGKTIEHSDTEEVKSSIARRDFGEYPLCNWKEIEIMHKSGSVDIQSHGMYHQLISVSPKIIDFVHPGFDVHHYGNIHIPVYESETGELTRKKVLGHPVYENAPRLSGRRRFLDSKKVRAACGKYVLDNGNEEFFNRKTWRTELNKVVKEARANLSNHEECYESSHDAELGMRSELAESKSILKEKLDKDVQHFCYPWFAGSARSAEMLCETGYKSACLGATYGFKPSASVNGKLTLITRLQEEYLMLLPGVGSCGFLDVFKQKIG